MNASYKPAYVYGGPTMSVSKLSEELTRAGCIVQVFTTTANGPSELPVAVNTVLNVDGVSVTYFKRFTKDHSHFSPALLLALWKQAGKFDIIHIHAWWNLVSILSCLIARLRGLKVVISPRGTLSAYSFQHKSSLSKRALHVVLGRPLLNKSFIHTTALNELTALQTLIKPRHFFNIPNFVQLPAHENLRTRKKSDTLKLLFLSRIDEKKGLDILLKALARVSHPYHLSIVGNGNDAYITHLKKIAQQNNLSQHISWLGFQHGDKFETFNAHDIFVLPSHDENFGNVVIESLSVGTAVLVSKNVGLAPYVSNHSLGWVFELDVLSLTQAINAAATQTEHLATIRQKAPQQVRVDFEEKCLTQQYMAMYNEILKHG